MNYRESLKKYFSHIEICGEDLPEEYYKEMYIVLKYLQEEYGKGMFDKLKIICICKIKDELNGKQVSIFGRYQIGNGIIELNSEYYGLNASEEKKSVLKNWQFREVLLHMVGYYFFEKNNLLESIRKAYYNDKEFYDAIYNFPQNFDENIKLNEIHAIEFAKLSVTDMKHLIKNNEEVDDGNLD
jgi:translation elongation factor EF-Ts